MIVLWMLSIIVVIVAATLAAIKWGPELPLDDRARLDKKSRIKRSLVEAKRRNLK